MPVSIEDAKKLDLVRHPVVATRAKLDAEAMRKEIIDTLRILKGAENKLQLLLNR